MKFKNNIVFYFPSIENGGVEKNFFLLIDYFKDKCNLFIVTGSKINLKHKNINIITFKKKIFFLLPRNIKNILCFILFLISKPKNAKILSFQYNISAIILSKITGSSIAVRSNQSPENYSNSLIKTKCYQFFFKLADVIIVNSYQFKKNFKKKFTLNSKVIYNLLDPINKIDILKKKFKPKIYTKNKVKFIIIGRLVKQKNHLLALKALSKISRKKFELIILGSGNEENNIKNYIRNNKLEKNIKIIKFKKNIYPYLKCADILLLPSLFEGLPNVLIEALMLKKIIISSNCNSGPSEILANGKYGYLFETNNHNDLFKKINFCINNITKCKSSKKILYGYKSINRFDKNINGKKYYQTLIRL